MPYLYMRNLEEERDATDDTQVHDEIDALFNYLEGNHHESLRYGITLIPEDEWIAYTIDFIREVEGQPKVLDSNDWPWKHLKMDWDAAAEELKGDYLEVE